MGQKINDRLKELELKVQQLENENNSLKLSGSEKSKENQKQILKKLLEEENRYILSQSLSKTGSWACNMNEEKIWVSDEMCRILGIEREGNHITEDQILINVHPDDKIRVENALSDIFIKNKNLNISFKIVKYLDEEREVRSVELLGQILYDDDNKPKNILGVIKDVSEYQKSIKELNRAKERAEESDKLKTAFLANMSHDLRTPMNAIIGYSELLNIGNLSPSNRREYTQIIKQKGTQLLTLIDDIIEVSKFETGNLNINKTEFSLYDLLKEVKDVNNDIRIDFGKENIDLRLSVPEKQIDIIFSDPGRIQQVLNSLISNSIKFTDKGYVEFGYYIDETDRLVFFVKDTGKGLSKDKIKHIFNRFKSIEKTKKIKYAGSGLGLTIAKGIIELLGGKIWLESEEEKGTTFYFTTPYRKPEDRDDFALSQEKSELTEFNWKNKVILIVEDEEVNFKFLETVLHDTQVQILRAKDGLQAIDLCVSIHKIDLILMDIKMPEMDGYEAARRIKQIKPEIPIIAQTAFASREDKLKSLKSGCDDYISKPIEIELMISKIDKFFSEKDY